MIAIDAASRRGRRRPPKVLAGVARQQPAVAIGDLTAEA
jgi:hypothetical protein